MAWATTDWSRCLGNHPVGNWACLPLGKCTWKHLRVTVTLNTASSKTDTYFCVIATYTSHDKPRQSVKSISFPVFFLSNIATVLTKLSALPHICNIVLQTLCNLTKVSLALFCLPWLGEQTAAVYQWKKNGQKTKSNLLHWNYNVSAPHKHRSPLRLFTLPILPLLCPYFPTWNEMQAVGKTSSHKLTQGVWTEGSFGKVTQAFPTDLPQPVSLLNFPCRFPPFGISLC